MGLRCRMTGHQVVQRGVRNGRYLFGRCARCGSDMMTSGNAWRQVPRGFRIVWRPRTEQSEAGAGAGAFARQVDLHGVTVIGERLHGAQRFALVVLNPQDEPDYRALADPVGINGRIAGEAERAASSFGTRLFRRLRRPQPERVGIDPLLLRGPERARPRRVSGT